MRRFTTTDPVSRTPLPIPSLLDPSGLQIMPYVSPFGQPSQRQGKEIRFDEWIPTLERSAAVRGGNAYATCWTFT